MSEWMGKSGQQLRLRIASLPEAFIAEQTGGAILI
jgi:hypothetical protein